MIVGGSQATRNLSLDRDNLCSNRNFSRWVTRSTRASSTSRFHRANNVDRPKSAWRLPTSWPTRRWTISRSSSVRSKRRLSRSQISSVSLFIRSIKANKKLERVSTLICRRLTSNGRFTHRRPIRRSKLNETNQPWSSSKNPTEQSFHRRRSSRKSSVTIRWSAISLCPQSFSSTDQCKTNLSNPLKIVHN